MKKKEKIKLIIDILDRYFPSPKIPLKYFDAYSLLIATVLSTQTTDKCVNKVIEKLYKIASTPEEMALLSPLEIEKIISPCGLYHKKAKALINLSKTLIEKHRGKVPKTFKELESLEGVGHKTASIILSQAFNKYAFPVDTHISRCAKRWKLSKGKSVRKIEKDLKKIFPKKLWKKLHLQIIYFGKVYCKAKGHKKEICPICSKLD